MNVNGTRVAYVASEQHCVYIYSVDGAGKRVEDAVVFGTAGTAGSAYGQLNGPRFACFVNRNGVDTLFISDRWNDRVVEVTASGVFLRAIAMKENSWVLGIAYCGTSDVIAVSLHAVHAVLLLQYESGAVKPEVTIGSGTWGRGDGQLNSPVGVSFTTDGRYILVADYGNHRVCMFSAASGAFITHVISNGIHLPRDVLQCGDGSIVVAQGLFDSASVVCVGEDGGLVQNSSIPSASELVALSYSPSLNGVVVKTVEGAVFLLRNAWMHSSRCAWLSALSFS